MLAYPDTTTDMPVPAEKATASLKIRLTHLVGSWIAEDTSARAIAGAELLGEIAREVDIPTVVTLRERAKQLGLSEGTLYRTWKQRGGYKDGGCIRFRV